MARKRKRRVQRGGNQSKRSVSMCSQPKIPSKCERKGDIPCNLKIDPDGNETCLDDNGNPDNCNYTEESEEKILTRCKEEDSYNPWSPGSFPSSSWWKYGGTDLVKDRYIKCPECQKRSVTYTCSRGTAASCFYYCENVECMCLLAVGPAVGVGQVLSSALSIGDLATGHSFTSMGLDDVGQRLVGAE